MTLSPVLLWFVTSAMLAVGLVVLLVWKQRQERAVSEFSDQVHSLVHGPATGRVSLEGGPEALENLGSAINKLLDNFEHRGAHLRDREQMLHRLVENVHDAVLVHRQHILFANTRFLSLLGAGAADVVGRPLSDFVAPEYVELVQNNLRRRLGGDPAAERYEVELKLRDPRSQLKIFLLQRGGLLR